MIASLLSAVLGFETSIDVLIVANNGYQRLDHYGLYLDESSGSKGLPKMLAETVREKHLDPKNLMIIDGGDTKQLGKYPNSQATVIFTVRRTWEPAQSLDRIGLDSHVLGHFQVDASYKRSTDFCITQEVQQMGLAKRSESNFKLGITDLIELGEPKFLRKSNQIGPVVFSHRSVAETILKVDNEFPDLDLPVICASGTVNLDRPTFVVFPPAGVVLHYRLVGKGESWKLNPVFPKP